VGSVHVGVKVRRGEKGYLKPIITQLTLSYSHIPSKKKKKKREKEKSLSVTPLLLSPLQLILV
jgi:hypothetical protein